MRSITKFCIYLPATAMILAAFAVPAAAQSQVPFNGALQAHDSDAPGPAQNLVVVTTSGTALGLQGPSSFTQTNTVNLDSGTETGSGTWTLSNGDMIFTTITGSGQLAGNSNLIRITEINTITGGTGVCAGAHGSFIVERWASPVTFMTAGSFHGAFATPALGH